MHLFKTTLKLPPGHQPPPNTPSQSPMPTVPAVRHGVTLGSPPEDAEALPSGAPDGAPVVNAELDRPE